MTAPTPRAAAPPADAPTRLSDEDIRSRVNVSRDLRVAAGLEAIELTGTAQVHGAITVDPHFPKLAACMQAEHLYVRWANETILALLDEWDRAVKALAKADGLRDAAASVVMCFIDWPRCLSPDIDSERRYALELLAEAAMVYRQPAASPLGELSPLYYGGPR